MMTTRPDPAISLLQLLDRRGKRARQRLPTWGTIQSGILTLDTGEVFELGTYAVWGTVGEGSYPVFYMQGGHDVLVLGTQGI